MKNTIKTIIYSTAILAILTAAITLYVIIGDLLYIAILAATLLLANIVAFYMFVSNGDRTVKEFFTEQTDTPFAVSVVITLAPIALLAMAALEHHYKKQELNALANALIERVKEAEMEVK